LDLSAEGRARVVLVTLACTVLATGLALYLDSFNFGSMTAEGRVRAILIDFLLPVGLAAPLTWFFMSKLRELAIAHRKLTVLAATDSLTSVLNRGAFLTLVDAWLSEVRAHERDVRGALLVVDADNFKSINDRYGHDRGDEALRLIAGAIRSVLRSVDIIGRMGGEEFGVFLPGTTSIQAEVVAERIRLSVGNAPFAPEGALRALSVSIGGAAFERRLPFSDLFRLADQQLYLAKQRGRNRVAVSPIVHYDTLPAAAA
jgi:diguanylate cyclase (GGDEF)-like protein